MLDFVEPLSGETLGQALEARRALAQPQAVIDFGLHMTITNDRSETLDQIPALSLTGCTSFKTYLTYPGFRFSDSAFLNVLTAVKEAGGIVMVHAENDAIIDLLKRRFQAGKKTARATMPSPVHQLPKETPSNIVLPWRKLPAPACMLCMFPLRWVHRQSGRPACGRGCVRRNMSPIPAADRQGAFPAGF